MNKAQKLLSLLEIFKGQPEEDIDQYIDHRVSSDNFTMYRPRLELLGGSYDIQLGVDNRRKTLSIYFEFNGSTYKPTRQLSQTKRKENSKDLLVVLGVISKVMSSIIQKNKIRQIKFSAVMVNRAEDKPRIDLYNRFAKALVLRFKGELEEKYEAGLKHYIIHLGA